ncbi:nuclear transport factor 2 family protein [Streptomyces griseoincarnatus]|uniref:nuclear transport factor 2 family protein n=1 Tax=Promicromonospora sp. NPDC057138 TaxID=3346031 RepID=UPI00362F12B7
MAVTDQPAAVPAVIQEFIDATNAGDTERFVATFTDDAYLNDWGREFHGPDGVRSWNETDHIGMKSRLEVVSVEPGAAAGDYTATIKVTSNRFNGTGPFKFTLRDGKIARLVLS